MTERVPPLNLQNSTTHTAAGDRALIYSIFQGREGVVGSGDLLVTQNGTPNMSVNIAAGRAVVLGDTSGDQQLYHVWNDSTVNKVISAANATNPRRDLVVAEIRDHQIDGGGANDWRLRVITGTPAASPVDPALPSSCLPLARITVAANATSITSANITDLRGKAGTASSTDLVCTSTTRPPNPVQGMRIYEADTYRTMQYTTATTGWQPPWNVAWGRVGGVVLSSVGSTASSTPSDISGLTTTFAAVPGRRYRASLSMGLAIVSGTAGIGSAYIVQGSTIIGGVSVSMDGNSYAPGTSIVEFTSAGSTTIKGQWSVTGGASLTGNVSANLPAVLIVEDIGPSANPA